MLFKLQKACVLPLDHSGVISKEQGTVSGLGVEPKNCVYATASGFLTETEGKSGVC